MNVFEKTYTINNSDSPYTFPVWNVYQQVMFLTKGGIVAHPLNLFVKWFFPRVVPSPEVAGEVDAILADEYKMALNDLMSAGLIEIMDDSKGVMTINLTEYGKEFVPQSRKIFNFQEELKKAKLYAIEQAKVDAERDRPVKKQIY
jgi:hypothetical protein